MKKINLTWTDYFELIFSLCSQLKKDNIEGVIGIGRGGLIPATIISHKLKIPMGSIFAKSYTENNMQSQIKISPISYIEIPTKNIALIDDICDSGNTLIEVNKILKKEFEINCKSAVIFKSINAKIKPDYFVEEIENTWVNFPYE